MIATVVIPCYNHNEEVKGAVQSALDQTVMVEIIIVDDGSTEPVQDIWNGRVRVIRHQENRGLSAALNTAIRASTSDRWVICAADDKLAPAHAELTTASEADIVSVDMRAGGRHIQCKAGDLETLKHSNCHSYAAMVKKELWEKVGGFKEGMDPSWEDYEFWLNCAKHGATWKHINLPLHEYNRNPKGRDVEAQGQDLMLRGLLEGHHQDLFGKGRGVVAFIIPCFKHEQYLKDAVRSVLNQTYAHCKVVVVDDGSPGDVSKALAQFLKPGDPVLEVRQANKGLAAARNAGIEAAMEAWNPQYLVMLDADDAVHPKFVTRTMAAMRSGKDEFIYTNIQFIGDAWHQLELKEFSCQDLRYVHQHPCTFLMPSRLPQRLKKQRGFVYDESDVMRIGFEDWEFSMAAVEVGFCGKHLSEFLFNYRFHDNGSMRTRAEEKKDVLVSYLRRKHPLFDGGGKVCTTCGGGSSFTASSNGGVTVLGLGNVVPGEPIEVTYMGTNQSTQTKIGFGGRIYKYSGKDAGPTVKYPRVFVIDGRDIKYFGGQFTFRKLNEVVAEEETPGLLTEIVLGPHIDTSSGATLDQLLVEDDGFDFTQLAGVGPATNAKLREAGITELNQVTDMTTEQLAAVLGNKKAAELLVQAAVSYGR
jgi:glycosyltransferase involved in cell wall biosynthesis